jgi:hypothetical protein
MKRSLYISRLTAILLTFFIAPMGTSAALAQSTGVTAPGATGVLSGVVRDLSGAVVPRPTIVVRQAPSGLERVD